MPTPLRPEQTLRRRPGLSVGNSISNSSLRPKVFLHLSTEVMKLKVIFKPGSSPSKDHFWSLSRHFFFFLRKLSNSNISLRLQRALPHPERRWGGSIVTGSEESRRDRKFDYSWPRRTSGRRGDGRRLNETSSNLHWKDFNRSDRKIC